MTEVRFIEQNIDKWERFEQALTNGVDMDTTDLADLFIEVTDDLSYARTHFSTSDTAIYLNDLTQQAYHKIYKYTPKRFRFKEFWTVELPLLFYDARKELLLSFVLFIFFAAIGAVSTHYEQDFVRKVLGDSYVDMTMRNIEKGDPLAVYKHENQLIMFISIAYNNIKVSFMAFGLGAFFGIGTMFLLFRNSVMVGSFQYFFIQNGLAAESLLTVWLHGVIEIISIIIAAAAGFKLGLAIVRPQTYKRIDSLKIEALKGAKIILGLVPLFVVAAFIESFITRYNHMPVPLALLIIFGSLFFMMYYIIIYPKKVVREVVNKTLIPKDFGVVQKID